MYNKPNTFVCYLFCEYHKQKHSHHVLKLADHSTQKRKTGDEHNKSEGDVFTNMHALYNLSIL